MLNEELARLAVAVSMDAGEFATGSTSLQKELGKLQGAITSLGDQWMQAGKRLTIGVTTPLAAIAAGVIKTSADFEAAMIRVSISSEASSAEMKAMSDLALKLGKDTNFGATEAADAMDMLAKNGLGARDILNGAATAAVNLAAAAGTDLAPAADAITDVMQQFGIAAGELPEVVNQIVGSVNESKLDFNDFALAIGQAGGVAGAAGVEFTDFTAVLAGTSSLFASGSDAGTSFKTFLTALPGKSSTAAKAIHELGLRFYDANGNLRSMGEIAQELQDKLGGLNDQARQEALTKIFGTDGMRTAIGLMQLGQDGLDKLLEKIAKIDAAKQAEKRLEGFNGKMEELSGALETLAIKIGNSGLLEAATSFVDKLGGIVDWLSQSEPWVLQLATAFGIFAAALGPMMLLTGTLAATLLPLFAARFGPIGLAISAIINPLGTAISLFGGFVAKIGAMTILKTIGGLLVRFVPWVAAVAAVGMLISDNWEEIAPVLNKFWEAAKQTLGPPMQELIAALTKDFTEFWEGPWGKGITKTIELVQKFGQEVWKWLGKQLVELLKELGSFIIGVFAGFADALRMITALINGDTDAAMKHLWNLAKRVAPGFAIMAEFAVKAVQGLFQGVKTWLNDKLAGVFNWVRDRTREVSNFFRDMYVAVVGNSFVPDMVDGIAFHMARLQAEMVDPARAATQSVTEAAREMARETAALLDRLFPEIARARQMLADRDRLTRAGLGEALEGEARLRLVGGRDRAAVSDGLTGTGPLAEVAQLKQAGDELLKQMGALGRGTRHQTVQIAESFRDMAQGSIRALERMSDAIKGGGFLDILGSAVGLFMQLGSTGLFGKGLARNINTARVPGFAQGTNYAPGGLALVGERGPELVNLPRGSQVISNRDLRAANDRGGRLDIYVGFDPRSGNLTTFVDGRIGGAAPAIAAGAAEGTARRLGRQASRRVGW